ncbi:uncharacterized protein [Eurosta solidaginis]|uniref:uncharacterized protein n=1 Tax=Eurosta solidaginis TaxID=178769 RepID=UPI0035317217
MATLERDIQHEVPSYLYNGIVFCDKYLHQRKPLRIVLARSSKFYIFYQKQLLNCIDLSGTVLSKVEEAIRDYTGPKTKGFKSVTTRSEECISNPTKQGGIMETTELQSTILGEVGTNVVANIAFGKYIYRNFDINKVYILIHCWDKLVVIDIHKYSIVTEYEDVKHFRIVHGKVKFIAILELQFENGSTLCTDFQTNEYNHQETNNNTTNRGNFKQMLERVRCANAELQLHKSATQRDFGILRDLETHGCNFVRSENLEEKPMIARCGDIWSRFVTNDTLVLGVPLVNNCSANSLTLLKNLKPILKTNDVVTENIFYKYRLYQLRTKFEDLEAMETFFQTEDDELKTYEQFWVDCKCTQLLPASFGVLLIALKIADIFLIEVCPLFLYFEIEKAPLQRPIGLSTIKTRTYEQHLFLKTLNVTDLIRNREIYALSFDTLTCNQDFLACAMLNKERTLYIELKTRSNSIIFEQIICKNFNFKTFDRNLRVHESEISHKLHSDADLNEDQSMKPTQAYFATGICFNNDPTSLWYGSMVIKTTSFTDEEANQVWKLYLYNEERAFVCLKSLLNELEKCTIKNIKYFVKKHDVTSSSHYLDMKNSLTAEIECLRNLNKYSDADKKKQIFKDLLKVQIDSDVLMTNV